MSPGAVEDEMRVGELRIAGQTQIGPGGAADVDQLSSADGHFFSGFGTGDDLEDDELHE
jgi:hypothetical protein